MPFFFALRAETASRMAVRGDGKSGSLRVQWKTSDEDEKWAVVWKAEVPRGHGLSSRSGWESPRVWLYVVVVRQEIARARLAFDVAEKA